MYDWNIYIYNKYNKYIYNFKKQRKNGNLSIYSIYISIIQTGITCKKFYYKGPLKSVCLWSRAQLGTRYIQKGDLFLVTGPPIKFDSCFWILRKDEKRIKVNLYLDLEESQW